MANTNVEFMRKLFEKHLTEMHNPEKPVRMGYDFRMLCKTRYCEHFGLEFTRENEGKASGVYATVLNKLREVNDPRVVGLGRPPEKNNGGRKRTQAAPLTLEEIAEQRKLLEAAEANLLKQIPPDLFTQATVEAVAEATVDAVAEATVEAVAEATVEAVAEATVEAVAEATVEAVAEATVEAVAEATVEAVAEATVEAVAEATVDAVAEATVDAVAEATEKQKRKRK